MKKTISVVALASILAAGTAFASGYRIPEQSADSTAKAGANIAGALGPDAAYFNPANMSWMDNEGWVAEGDLSYIYLSSIEYEDNRTAFLNDESEDENFIVPTLFLVSPDYSGFRIGFATVAPFGLQKRWKDGFGATFAEKFSLSVIEMNPSVSYEFCNWFSFAAGARLLYSQATVMSNGVVMAPGITASRYMDGDALDYGWNAALSARPTEESNISVTYRSKVDLDFDGDVLLSTNAVFLPGASVDTDGDVSIPGPAVLAVSGSYDFGMVKVEFTVDRTYWSDYETLDFSYDIPIVNPILFSAFDAPKTKNWDDVNAYRIGLDYRVTPEVTIMAGFAYDENPVPDETVGFDLPDSDAYIYSIGARYKISQQSEIAFGLLYDYKESRMANNSNVNGEFTNASAVFASLGYTYKF
jgi:long-chain fatty acid transport protein